jgi:hypothetical protein
MRKIQKKIVIFEVLYHSECLKLPYKIFKKMNFKVKIFVGNSVYKNLKSNGFENKDLKIINLKLYDILWKKTLKKIRIFKIYQLPLILLNFFLIQIDMFLASLKFFIYLKKEKPDYIYINTLDNIFSWFLIFGLIFIKKKKVIYTIHSTNILQKNNSKYLIEKIINNFQIFFLKIIFKNSKGFVILGDYLDFNFKDKPLIKITNRCIEKNNETKFNRVTFCINGHGKGDIKNFKNIFENFSKYLKLKSSNENFQIIINGSCEKNVINLIKKYNLNKFVVYYEKYIDESILVKNIKKSHYIIIPTYKNSRYGKYSISGGFGDAIAFKIPVILPSHYSNKLKNEKYIFKYEENFLYKDLKKLIDLKNYKKMIKEIEIKRKFLSVKNLSNKFKEVF